MTIDYEKLMARVFPVKEVDYTPRDSMLYALGIGLSLDPVDRRQLQYTYEESLVAFPTMALVLGFPGFWAKQADTGIDWRKLVHGEQSLTLHRPLGASGRLRAENRVTALYDKGFGKGAVLIQERKLVDGDGDLVATVEQLSLLRGDGGFGGPAGRPPEPHALPQRSADLICYLSSSPQAALIYRLSGDFNPLHADPDVAAAAGFDGPILHGMCTMAMACHAAMRSYLDYRAQDVAAMRVRFSAPFMPGETLRTELWRDGAIISFRAFSKERNIKVLDCGRLEIRQ